MSTATMSPNLLQSTAMLSLPNMFSILVVTVLTLSFTYWYMSRRHMIKLSENIPGVDGWPLLGNALEFIGLSSQGIFDEIHERSKKFGRIVKLWIGPRLLVFLTDPADIELILSSHVHIDKSPEYCLFKPWLGEGLLTSTGQKWKADRKLIAPTFHSNVLKLFVDLFNKNSRETVKKMEKEIGKEFDVQGYMSEATVEMLLETAMGMNKKTLDQSGYDYAMAVMKLCDILHIRHTKLWLYPEAIFKLTKLSKYQKSLINVIHSVTRKVIKQKKADFERGIRGLTADVPEDVKSQKYERNVDPLKTTTTVEGTSDDVGEKKRMVFLDLMIEASQNGVVVTDEEMKEHVDSIMFAGHDTTTTASSFFLCQMAAHPDVQEKVVQELREIFGESDRPATFGDTLEMNYMERCLLETMRLFPPVPIIARQLQKDIKAVSDPSITLPAGATIVIAQFGIHRLEEIYPNPEVFDPDRFLPEKAANRHYYAFIPFSAGPRSCAGRKYAMLKLKILLSTILRNYKVSSNLKEKDYKLQGDIILKRADGFRIMLEPRKTVVSATA